MANTPEGTPYVESSDLVANYPAASLALANRIDLVGVLPFANAAARTTAIPTPTDGQFTYLQDTNSTEFYNGAAFQALGGGKVLQIVRATDTTERTTTSTSFVDTNINVTITPTKTSSAVILIASFLARVDTADDEGKYRITDNSNNAISGAESYQIGQSSNTVFQVPACLFAYSTPATTSATTYKLRFSVNNAASRCVVSSNICTSEFYAIEVSA